MPGFWYLGSPYSLYPDGIDAAFDAVVQARGLLIRAGIQCFSPIIHSHTVAKACGIDSLDHSIWLPAERPILDAATGLIVLKLAGWEASFGLTWERSLFAERGLPIVGMEPGEVPAELLP